jgi:hypothetical protein
MGNIFQEEPNLSHKGVNKRISLKARLCTMKTMIESSKRRGVLTRDPADKSSNGSEHDDQKVKSDLVNEFQVPKWRNERLVKKLTNEDLEKFAFLLSNNKTEHHESNTDPYKILEDKTVQLHKLKRRELEWLIYKNGHEMRF